MILGLFILYLVAIYALARLVVSLVKGITDNLF